VELEGLLIARLLPSRKGVDLVWVSFLFFLHICSTFASLYIFKPVVHTHGIT
jgi:hypothetical protein